MKITFWGGVRTVTGSRHLLRVGSRTVLLDCGLFQGRRDESERRNRLLPFDAQSVDAVLLSHAHIDHSGNLPALVRHGFRGAVHATAATTDLCRVMLPDSAHIQEKDVEFVNRRARRRGSGPREPLYTVEDAEAILSRFEPRPYDVPFPVSEGITATFRDAGHILGSAMVELNLEEKGVRRRVLFTGDLGRAHLPILRDPTPLGECDVLLIESTYGNRLHPPPESVPSALADIVNRVRERGGKILIPAFAVGRAQEIIWVLRQLIDAGSVPPIPIYVDSPLAVDATEIFARHPECYDAETRALLGHDRDPFGFRLVRYIRRVEDSMALNGRPETCIILSASGMCEAGRILHHLRNNIEDPRNLVLIVGFQAEDTLGKRLVERRPIVRIFGEEFALRAEVVTMNGFSAHADRSELLGWAASEPGRPRRTFVVHGSEDQSEALAAALADHGFRGVEVPELGQEFGL